MGDPVFDAFREAFLRGNDALRRGDIREAWRDIPEDCELHPPPEFPDPAVRRGPEQITEYVTGLRETISGWAGNPVEFIDAGEQTYIVHLEMEGTSAAVGFPLVQDLFQIYEIRDGRVARIREFLRREEAMRAAGIAD